MNDQKVPYLTKDWQSMDIYLFSNGQENTPPRKYHLRAEELNWWDATLNYLARSQYGSIHSTIDLYTTDGHKIEGPMQLQNGTAYVAVEPPNTFFDAGYDNYLIKATRSLEKRQAKKPNSTETLLPDENINKAEQLTETIITNSTQKNNAVVESNVVNGPTVQDKTLKSQTPPDRRSSQKSNLSSIKQTDKRRPSSLSRPPVLRRISTSNPIESPADSRKTSLKKRNSPPKRIFKLPEKTNGKVSGSSLGSKFEPTVISQTIYNGLKEALPIVETLEIKKATSELKVPSQSTINTEVTTPRSNVADDKQVKTVNNDKDIVVSDLYKNPVREMTSIVVDAGESTNRESITQELVKINEFSETSQMSYHNNNNSQFLDSESQKIKLLPKSSSKIKFTNAPSIQAYSVTEKQDDNYLAFINRGDIVNFQLKIEVRNTEGSVSTGQKMSKRISTTSLLKPEKCSQVRIDNDIFIQSRSLHAPTSEHVQCIINDANSKFLVVQCGCCERGDPNELKDRRYVMLLAPPKCSEHHERCKCDDNVPNEKEINKTYYSERPSIIHPVKKTYSDMSLKRLHIMPKREHEYVITQDAGTAPTNEDSGPKDELIVSRHVAIDEQRAKSPNSQNPSESVVETKKTEYTVIKGNPAPTNLVDKSTQTDWTNLLLEARCQDNGHYTFHLPPLQVLKYYDNQML